MRHLLAIIATANALSIGIDLGTSTSCCAVFRDGAPELVPRRLDGELLTPSVCAGVSNNKSSVAEVEAHRRRAPCLISNQRDKVQ